MRSISNRRHVVSRFFPANGGFRPNPSRNTLSLFVNSGGPMRIRSCRGPATTMLDRGHNLYRVVVVRTMSRRRYTPRHYFRTKGVLINTGLFHLIVRAIASGKNRVSGELGKTIKL